MASSRSIMRRCMGIGEKGNIKSNFHDSFGENLDLKKTNLLYSDII